MSQVYRITVLVNYRPEGQIRVIEHLEDVPGSSGYLAELGKYVFFLCGKHMRLFPESIFQSETVGFQFRILLDVFSDGFRFGCQKLRSEEGKGGGNLCASRAAPIVHGLIFCKTVILILFHGGIDKSPFQFQENTVFFGKGFIKSFRRFGNLSQIAGKFQGFLHTFLNVLFP